MARSAEQTSQFSELAEDNSQIPLCVPEELAPEPRELSFGAYLRRERALRGIERNDILRVTKVSPEYLDAIESNQFDQLPPKAFVLGFLRVLSEYAGLDENEVTTRYLDEFGRIESGPEEVPTPEPQSFLKRHLNKILGALGLACLVVLMFAPLLRD